MKEIEPHLVEEKHLMLPVNSLLLALAFIGSPYFARLLLSLAKPGTRGSQSFQVLPHYPQWPVWPSSYIGIGEQLYFGTGETCGPRLKSSLERRVYIQLKLFIRILCGEHFY